MASDSLSPVLVHSDTPSCSPAQDPAIEDELIAKSKQRNSLILTIGYKALTDPSSKSEGKQLIPYVRRIVDRGSVLVDNDKKKKLEIPRITSSRVSKTRVTSSKADARKSQLSVHAHSISHNNTLCGTSEDRTQENVLKN